MTFRSETLNWPEKLKTLQNMPTASRAEQKAALNLGESHLTSFRAIQACFDPEAMKKVHSAAQSHPPSANNALGQPNLAAHPVGSQQVPYIFSFSNAEALAGLKGKVADLPTAVHAALDFALAQHLTTVQIKALVKWIIAGKPVAEFDPKAKPIKASPKPEISSLSPDESEPETQSSSPNSETSKATRTSAHKGSHQTQTVGQRIDALLGSIGSNTKASKTSKKKSQANNLKWPEKILKGIGHVLWHYFIKQIHKACKAVAHYMVPIKSFENSFPSKHGDSAGRKRGSGSSSGPGPLIPTLLHWAVYCLCQLFFWWLVVMNVASFFSPALRPWFEWPFRFLAHLVFGVFPAWVWGQALTHLVLAIIAGVLLFIALSAAFKAQPGRMTVIALLFVALWVYGKGWNINPEAVNHQDTRVDKDVVLKDTTTSAPAPHLRLAHSHPMIPYQPKTSAWTTADETQDYLDQELFPVSKDSVIKTHTFEPDTAMGPDMAYHLVMDLQSPDKYTVFYGRDKAAVKTITTGASQITLTMQIGLLSPLTGSSNFNFYWADLKQLHCNLISSGTRQVYQCSLVLAESKKPLTIQCDSAVDLERLVSALEFYIRLSGHNAAPLGTLPYLNQGLRLNNDGVVTTLWADSPIAKAGLVIGDILWSVGKNTDHPQSKSELEAALQSLASGSYTLFKVTARGWKLALANKTDDDPDSFRPLRRTVHLTVP